MMKKNKLVFASKIILGLGLFAGSALFAAGNSHTGDHMHMGKMANHSNADQMTDKMMGEMHNMKNMKHSNHKMSSMNTKAYYNKMQINGYDIVLTSKKALKDGKNDMMVHIMKNGVTVDASSVKVKFGMPAMPGMEFTKNTMKMGSSYMTNVNFSMGGEWSYEIMLNTSDGKMHTVKGSVKL